MTTEHPFPLTGTALSWGCVPELDLIELAEMAARHGFPEISAQPGQYFRARQVPTWRRRLAATGVRVGVVDALMNHLPGSPDPGAVPRALRDTYSLNAEACLEAAVELGARTVNMAHFLGRPDVGVEEMAAGAREVGELVGQEGVRVSLEFIPGTGLPDLATTLQIVECAGSAAVGIMFDTWHHIRSGGTPTELSSLGPGRVFEVQINDWRAPVATGEYVPMTGRLAPGEGTAPVGEMVRLLRTASPDVVLGLEVFTSERGDPDGRVARLAAVTRTFLDRWQDAA
ncbi:sugar phosphate isomerase/epimerase [Rhodococcus sp. OK519]|uniref:sugar phosphate isomerase/epimerase family protein n=1 Tax=Rhodococcus sp. OK519 TaxID=2135729 RepID=UPI000D3B9C32|nr:sugar phosphate isomerase/epimerase [Rhodococcus sp. OK519]